MGQPEQDLKRMATEATWHGYSEGANYVMYAIAERLHVESKDIRLGRGTVYDKVDRLAQRIQESLSPTP